ncbi:FAD-dependent oxidoreductase [Candidatus Saccharibacteria bacterium]|nr:FAD-dependent oxidoreductase [Candidatus Saccharibacteria bacterium]
MKFDSIQYISKRHEYDDVYSYFFDKGNIQYQAGQCTHLLLGKMPLNAVVREMSFASAPSEDTIRFTMHIGSKSNFKSKIDSLKSGDNIKIFKIKGSFALPDNSNRPIVMLAGGVGMTPIRSILTQLPQDHPYNITLGQVQRGDFLFADEVNQKVSSHLQIDPSGFTSAITDIIRSNPNAIYYICGSDRFTQGALELLNQNSIDSHDIKIESFSKY